MKKLSFIFSQLILVLLLSLNSSAVSAKVALGASTFNFGHTHGYQTLEVRAHKGLAKVNDEVTLGSPVVPKGVGFSDDASRLALSNVGRVDHASRHLIDVGIIAGNPGSKAARKAFQDLGQSILTNPTKTFDHVMSRGGQRVKGFLGKSNGQDVIIFVAKDARGKVGVGDIVTAIKPSAQQLSNFGL